MIRDDFMDDYIEKEKEYDGCKEQEITEPFDPRYVDIVSAPMVISNIVDRLKCGDIDLCPEYQRHTDLWDPKKQSRLIESLLIRIPLPTFYFDVSDEDVYTVVDGVQRLSAIKNFMGLEPSNEKFLRLTGLEYLTELNGKSFDELPSNLQRRLRESQILCYIIRSGTPDKVKNSIFERINTGGMVLSPAEIKNSVYRGRASKFIATLADSDEFRKATNYKIKQERMLDRELVNRFVSFYILNSSEYQENIEDFLIKGLEKIKLDLSVDIKDIEHRFKLAMTAINEIFGKYAFKKKKTNGKYGKFNKPLFEALSVQMAHMSEHEISILIKNKILVADSFDKLFNDEIFVRVITSGTASTDSVKYRHNKIKNLLKECVMNDD